ncbi:hypothetical protein DFH09DRAFT_1083374 [Mycena vulgaris]|nr:hypothetical protein DFH09DRAFT_1083374 [Mycena vulgaris]
MFAFLALAALALNTAAASPRFNPITSISDVTAAAGVSVRIFEQFGHWLSLDPNYPGAPEFSPWFLVQQDNSTVKIQSVLFPDMFISYPTFGVSLTPPTHSMLVLRDNANAALFSITPINGVARVKLRCLLVRSIKVPAVGKSLTTWATTLNDTAVPPYASDNNFAPDLEPSNPRFYIIFNPGGIIRRRYNLRKHRDPYEKPYSSEVEMAAPRDCSQNTMEKGDGAAGDARDKGSDGDIGHEEGVDGDDGEWNGGEEGGARDGERAVGPEGWKDDVGWPRIGEGRSRVQKGE